MPRIDFEMFTYRTDDCTDAWLVHIYSSKHASLCLHLVKAMTKRSVCVDLCESLWRELIQTSRHNTPTPSDQTGS